MKHVILKTAMALTMLVGTVPVHALDHLVWKSEGGKQYWYENGTRQGVAGDPKNITDTVYGYERGREIYDPVSDGWYWLDAIYGGAKAENKEVWMPYIYQSDLEAGINKQGKWVRYNADGKMIKGWYTPAGSDMFLYPTQYGKIYYYDLTTGEMIKGWYTIKGTKYHFDETSGVLDDLKTLWSYPTSLNDFISQFALGYAFMHGEMVYSSSNPQINTYPIIDSLIAPFLSCVNYTLYPGQDVYVNQDSSDPRGWYPYGYKCYDGFKIDWIRENVLNLAEHDFELMLADAEAAYTAYREPAGINDHVYYCEYPITGISGHLPTMALNKVEGTGDIVVVGYQVYEWYWDDGKNDWVCNSKPSGYYRAVLWEKQFNSTPYWSLISNSFEPAG